MYPIELIRPMAQELENSGFESLSSQEQVKSVLSPSSRDSFTGSKFCVWLRCCKCETRSSNGAKSGSEAEQIGYGFCRS